jgi:hypothetical protein
MRAEIQTAPLLASGDKRTAKWEQIISLMNDPNLIPILSFSAAGLLMTACLMLLLAPSQEGLTLLAQVF